LSDSIATLDIIMMQLYLLVKRPKGPREKFQGVKLIVALGDEDGFQPVTAPKTDRTIRLADKRRVRYSPCPKEKKRVGKQCQSQFQE